MSKHSQFRFGKCLPDMALYQRDETHFDLLVKDDSRLALLGLLAGAVRNDVASDDDIGYQNNEEEEVDTKNVWENVSSRKSKKKKEFKIPKKLLDDSPADDAGVKDIRICQASHCNSSYI